ncbi:hypothetical protein N8H41_04310 [Pseudomonas vlassakiae]|uniref:hypothetical protein n=1 Tax=Pseudomonas vlassakiae TaxID=485888 RepID=UPI0021C653A2|nr:hypothetical protein [Pseudomonas vlassakiae]MCU0123201.1 hypothetical protein [Pseudomonas vlassakiae]
MDQYRKLVVRSLQKILSNKQLQHTRAYGVSELLQDFKVHDELLLREALGEKTLRLYLKALRVATRKPLTYSYAMTVGDVIETLCTP